MRAFRLAPIFLLFATCGLAAETVPFQIGRVVAKAGFWEDIRTSPAKIVEVGTYVYNDSKLRRAGRRSSADFVQIRSSFTQKEESFQCSKPAICNDHENDRQYLEILSRLREPSSDFWRFLTDPSQRWIPAISPSNLGTKSIGSRHDIVIADGVVKIQNGKLDLSAVATDKLQGNYTVELCPAASGSWESCAAEPKYEVIDSADKGLKPDENAGWGTYRVRLAEQSSGTTPLRADTSWKILVAVPETQYSAVSDLYRQAVDVTATWADKSAADGARKSYLGYLSAKYNAGGMAAH